MKRITLFILLSLTLIIFCACSPQKSTTADSSTNTDTSAQSSSQSSNTLQLDQWSTEFNGKLPTPVCKITDVMRYDENSASGKLTIVNFSDMSKTDAEKYVEELKAMGFSGGVTVNDGTKIAFSGMLNEDPAQNGVNFLYTNSDQTGTISFSY